MILTLLLICFLTLSVSTVVPIRIGNSSPHRWTFLEQSLDGARFNSSPPKKMFPYSSSTFSLETENKYAFRLMYNLSSPSSPSSFTSSLNLTSYYDHDNFSSLFGCSTSVSNLNVCAVAAGATDPMCMFQVADPPVHSKSKALRADMIVVKLIFNTENINSTLTLVDGTCFGMDTHVFPKTLPRNTVTEVSFSVTQFDSFFELVYEVNFEINSKTITFLGNFSDLIHATIRSSLGIPGVLQATVDTSQSSDSINALLSFKVLKVH
ncbi:hypothetical protein RCL1_006868 [Eukaryota sp. TZLM3-RCL]